MSKEEQLIENNKIFSYHTINFVNRTKTKNIDTESLLFGKGVTLNKDQISQVPKNNIKFSSVSFSTTPIIWNNNTRIRSKN